jgi:hypothetical protein
MYGPTTQQHCSSQTLKKKILTRDLEHKYINTWSAWGVMVLSINK